MSLIIVCPFAIHLDPRSSAIIANRKKSAKSASNALLPHVPIVLIKELPEPENLYLKILIGRMFPFHDLIRRKP